MARTVWLLLLALILLAGCTRPQPPIDFDAWFAEHRKTCPNCSNPDNAMCIEAFEKFQEALRQFDDLSPNDGRPVK